MRICGTYVQNCEMGEKQIEADKDITEAVQGEGSKRTEFFRRIPFLKD